MRKLLSFIALAVTALSLSVVPFDDAQAKRFGFGKSMGKQYNSSRTTKPAGQQSTSTAAQTGARTSGASRWLGPLAGLAAGGLLASLFFGDAFEGFQIMDFLLIAGLVFVGLAMFRAYRARSAPQMGTAGGPPIGSPGGMAAGFDAGGSSDAGDTANFQTPDWFDEDGFVKGAKTHFIRLQAAWDKGDLKDIAEYTTPEFYGELHAERLSTGEQRSFTEVVTLEAEMLSVQRDGDQAVASVRFSGLIREELEGPANDFSEVWHVVHDWNSSEGDWFIAGIQQSR
ncbi:MAG: Tim44 domain-containing protein [Gammaproteobacteria bacterium]|nr:Tim44 domain-containing protein [Gammaproteobacteria bacterium]